METLPLGADVALVLGLVTFAFILNVPFGFLRSKTKKFSLGWFVCVHATLPVIYLGRLFSHLDYRYIPIFIAAAVMGQIWGGKLEL